MAYLKSCVSTFLRVGKVETGAIFTVPQRHRAVWRKQSGKEDSLHVRVKGLHCSHIVSGSGNTVSMTTTHAQLHVTSHTSLRCTNLYSLTHYTPHTTHYTLFTPHTKHTLTQHTPHTAHPSPFLRQTDNPVPVSCVVLHKAQ